MLSAFDIATSGLVAQRARLDVVANNVANLSTTRNEAGQAVPYQPRYVVFEADTTRTNGEAAGVRVSEIGTEYADPRMKYEPGHPDANADGYVAYPNINMMEQMVDAMGAARAYEANLGVIEVSKDLSAQTLSILA